MHTERTAGRAAEEGMRGRWRGVRCFPPATVAGWQRGDGAARVRASAPTHPALGNRRWRRARRNPLHLRLPVATGPPSRLHAYDGPSATTSATPSAAAPARASLLFRVRVASSWVRQCCYCTAALAEPDICTVLGLRRGIRCSFRISGFFESISECCPSILHRLGARGAASRPCPTSRRAADARPA
jgi:hypothetical protein